MTLYWLSWWQPGEDSRVLSWPPPDGVIGYWISGDRGGMNEDDPLESSVCALIRADSEDAAWSVVTGAGCWPDAGERRFCRPRDPAEPPSERFPAPAWSVEMGRWPWPGGAS